VGKLCEHRHNQNRAPSESIATARTWAIFAHVRCRLRFLKSRRMIRACVSSSRRDARDRRVTHASVVAEPPIQAVPAGTLRHLTNAVPALSRGRCRDYCRYSHRDSGKCDSQGIDHDIPLDRQAPADLDRELKKPFCQSTSTARLLQAYFTAKGFGFAICGNDRASVSRFVAGIGHGSPSRVPIGVGFATTPPRRARKWTMPSPSFNRIPRRDSTRRVRRVSWRER
jgi:hypothetical protein